jgi:hypothetical protein
MTIKKKYTPDQLSEKIKGIESCLAQIKEARAIINKAYDHNSAQIAECKKGEEYHKVLLVIEDVLNERSRELNDRAARRQETLDYYNGLLLR